MRVARLRWRILEASAIITQQDRERYPGIVVTLAAVLDVRSVSVRLGVKIEKTRPKIESRGGAWRPRAWASMDVGSWATAASTDRPFASSSSFPSGAAEALGWREGGGGTCQASVECRCVAAVRRPRHSDDDDGNR